jgi:galactose-1-phosphate uridylyltransferase
VNPFDLLAEEERRDGRRVIYHNDVFIAAAFAPTCPNELIMFPRDHVSHVLQLNDFNRKKLMKPVLGVFLALFFYLGITDLNIAIHMAPFKDTDEARDYYRWHMHVYPRRSRLPSDRAGSEIGFGTQIIDVLPETTAEILRKWYREGPKEELVAKAEDDQPNPRLLEEFRRLMG